MIKLFDLKINHLKKQKKINQSIFEIIRKSNFIMGDEVYSLEKKLSKKLNTRYVVTCANGTDALNMSLMTFGFKKNSYVFVTNFSYIATAEVIKLNNLIPVFVDIDYTNFNICPQKLEEKIDKYRNRNIAAIISVDLFGYPAEHEKISKIAKKFKLKYIIDGSQSLGSKIKNKFSSNFGDVYTTSFFPTKPLGCFGDGGAVFTNNKSIARKITSLKFHGKGKHKNQHLRVGLNSRLDTIQAAILNQKINMFDNETLKKNLIANRYLNEIKNKNIILPVYKKEYRNVYALFTIKTKKREKLIKLLKKNNISTGIYYSKPLSNQKVFKKSIIKYERIKETEKVCKECLSIPCHANLKNYEVSKIINLLNNFK